MLSRNWKIFLVSLLIVIAVAGAIYARRSLGTKLNNVPGTKVQRASDNAQLVRDKPQLVVQLGHAGGINAAVFSPDGQFVASGGADRVSILWEVATGREVRRLIGHKGEIRSVAFSPDGHWILTGAGGVTSFYSADIYTKDYTARLWDIATGKEIQRFEGHTERINGVAFTKDGRSAITVSDDATIRLWNVTDGKEIRRFANQAGAVSSVSISPDGRYILTGDGELPDGSDSSRRLYTARLWEVETGKEVKRFAGHDKGIGSVAFSNDGQIVITSDRSPYIPGLDRNYIVRLWDVSSGRKLQTFTGFGPVAFSSDNRQILRGGLEDEAATVWQLDQKKNLCRFENGEVGGVPTSVAFSPDGREALVAFDKVSSGGSSGAIIGDFGLRLYDAGSCKEILQFAGTTSRVDSVEAGPEDRLIFAGDYLWDLQTGKEVRFEKALLKHPNPVDADLRILSPDGRFAFTTCITRVSDPVGASRLDLAQIWDTTIGKEVRRFEHQGIYAAYFSSDSRSILTVSKENGVQMREVATGKKIWNFGGKYGSYANANGSWLSQSHSDCVLSSDGRFVLVRTSAEDGERVSVLRAETGELTREIKVPDYFYPLLTLAPNNQYLAIPNIDDQVRLYDVSSGRMLRRFKPGFEVFYAVFSPDSQYLALGGEIVDKPKRFVQVWEVNSGKKLLEFEGVSSFTTHQNNMTFSPDSRYLLKADIMGNTAYLWDVAAGKEVRRLDGHLGDVYSTAFLKGGRVAVTASQDGTTRMWDATTGRELCRLISFRNGTWVVVTPDGRFDTNNLDNIKGLSWTIGDDPMRLLPLEIFMRDYYEPRLLPRLLSGEEFTPIRDLSTLNRIQPQVKITEIALDSADTVKVTVDVSKAQREVLRNGTKVVSETGVYDLRLFRDGQLVGYAPEAEGEVKVDSQMGKSTLTFSNIRLPHRKGMSRIEFSAYAFNADRVKSETDRKVFDLPSNVVPVKGRVYLITFGVNANENPSIALRYAANDAREMERNLSESLGATGQYQEIVPVTLIADYATDGGQRTVSTKLATKVNFKTVLDVLAGKQVAPDLLRAIPGAQRLQAARPEDLVLIAVSSHGYADNRGIFYLVPYDTGQKALLSAEFLQRCISSDELQLWLRDVDAGELTLIVDSCQSAAAVEGGGFKPGPMGSRGLGQLSYDKGMRILTATQADNVALETGKLEQGLLTYALVRDGIESGAADYKPIDRQIMLSEWLSYGVDRVPAIYNEVRSGKRRLMVQGEENGSSANVKVQRPGLFDFAHKQRDLVIAVPVARKHNATGY